MFWIFLIDIVNSQWPNIEMKIECLSQYECIFRGQNRDNLLFECDKQYTILLEKTAINTLNTTKFLIGLSHNQWLYDQYLFQLEGGFLTITETKYLQNIETFNSLMINESLTIVSTLRKQQSTLLISSLFLETDLEYQCLLYCYEGCNGLQIQQYFDEIQQSLMIVVGLNFLSHIYIVQFTLTDTTFKLIMQLDGHFDDLLVTHSGLMIVFTQGEIKIYKISEKLHLQQTIQLKNAMDHVLIKDLETYDTKYVLLQKQFVSSLLFKITNDNLILMFEDNLINIQFPLDAVSEGDKIILLYKGFQRIIVDLSIAQINNFQEEGICQKINIFYEQLKQNDYREFDKIYNEIHTKGDSLKWIYHPGQPMDQILLLKGTLDWNNVKQRIYTYSPAKDDGQWEEVKAQHSHTILEGTSFQYELIFLSEIKVNDLILSIEEKVDASDLLYLLVQYYYEQIEKTVKAIIITIILIFLFCCCCFLCYKGIAKSIRLIRTYQLEQQIIKKFSYLPTTVIYEESECLICLGKFEIKQKVSQTQCGHTFHYNCFKDWMTVCNTNIKCPTCNQLFH